MAILMNIRRDDFHKYNFEAVSTGFRDPFGVADFNNNSVVAFTAPHEQTSDIMPVSAVLNHVSFYKARMSLVVKKNEEFHVETRISAIDRGAFSAGSSVLTWELKMVVAPFVWNFDHGKPTGLRFVWLARLTGTEELASTEFPCSGYLTNLSVLCTLEQGTEDSPSIMVWSTQDVNMITHLVTAGGQDAIKGSNHNAVTFNNTRTIQHSGDIYNWNYKHFGKSYIRLTNRAMLNFIFIGEGAPSTTVWFTGDFIPFRGSHWKQVYVHIGTDLVVGENWEDAIKFAVDLKNCQVAITANIASAEAAVMVVKLLVDGIDTQGDSFSSSTAGDIQDEEPYANQGLYSAQNLGAIIPFSGSVGSQSTVLNLGNVTAGQLLAWDMISETLTVASKIFFVITGQVNREYYSKNNKFIYSTDTFDHANLEAMSQFQ